MFVSKQFHPLADGEVVSIKNTCRVSELAAQIRSQVASTLAEWSDEQGIDGEALRFGSQGWEKGKVRLRLTIEFCPEDSGATTVQSNTHNHPATAAAGMNPGSPVATAFGATATQASIHTAAVTSQPSMIVTESAPAPVAVMTPPAVPIATSNVLDEQFELGTMSDIDGAVNLNLLDEQGGYADFDLSAAVNDLNIEELVESETVRPTLVEEVWSEINQPNWPGVGRA
jgi:KGK domain